MTVVLLILSTICALIVIREELIGNNGIIYALGAILGVLFATLAGMICFYILGVKEGISVVENNEESADTFYARLLENFKGKFKDHSEYPGEYVKMLIDHLIKRIYREEDINIHKIKKRIEDIEDNVK